MILTAYHADVWADDDERVRAYPDDDADYFRDGRDDLAVLVTLSSCDFGGDRGAIAAAVRCTVEESYWGQWKDIVADLADRYGATVVVPLVQRGGALVVQEHPDDGEARIDALILDTAKGRDDTGVPDDRVREQVLAELDEYRLWASGNGLWAVAREVRRTWRRDDAPTVTRDEWTIEETVHGIIATEEEAVQLAADYFPRTERG